MKINRILISDVNHLILNPNYWVVSFYFNQAFKGNNTTPDYVFMIALILLTISSTVLFVLDMTFRGST